MPDLPPLPARMARLPLDKHGRPVPWFVAFIDGQPDFRVIGPGRMETAVRFGNCWVCGQPVGRYKAFVIGPMCGVNRVSAEPPSHRDCAVYSAQACPFLATPTMRRRETGLPEDRVDPAGGFIQRNPGVALVWVSTNPSRIWLPDGLLFNVGDPVEALWFAHGRSATRAEVLASIDSGMPLLRAEAEADPDPVGAVAELDRLHAAALRLIPAEAVTVDA